MTTYQVFISSTHRTNEDFRLLVEDAILRADMRPIVMESTGAHSAPPIETCLKLAREADLLICVLQHMYGTIPQGHQKSYTELEFDAAKERLVFISEEEMRESLMDPGDDKFVKQPLLRKFKERAQTKHHAAYFKRETLGVSVLQSLYRWQSERGILTKPAKPGISESPQQRKQTDAYFETAQAVYRTIRLFGFETKTRAEISLEDMYVPLHARLDSRGATAESEAIRDRESHREIALTDAFWQAERLGLHRGIVVVGHPGSGKSTLLRRLLLWVIEKKPESLALPDGMIPVLLPLRHFVSIEEGLAGLMRRCFDADHVKVPEFTPEALVTRGNLLLLFDGLDEISDVGLRKDVSAWIQSLMKQQPTNRFVVTSRYAGYSEDVALADVLKLELRELNTEQFESFVNKWFTLVECATHHDSTRAKSIASDHAKKLIEALRTGDYRSSKVFELTRNPLLLTAICLIHRDRGELPKRRVELYEEAVNVLLEHWRRASGLQSTFTAKEAKKVLQPLALWLHQTEGRVKATTEEIAAILEPGLKKVRANVSVKWFLERIRDESGLLTGFSADEFGFMHLAFQEYLAAREIRRLSFTVESALSDVAARFASSWWREITLILIALDEEPTVADALFAELIRVDAFADDPARVRECLEDAVSIPQEPFVAVLRDSRSKPRTREAAERILRHLGIAPPKATAPQEVTSGPTLIVRSPAMITSPRGGVELIRIEGGTFRMGPRDVTLSPFLLGKYAVTNEEYGRYLAANPGTKEPENWGDPRWNGKRQPVVGVKRKDATEFCRWVGGMLPTEAQWEYACRAGTTTKFSFPDESKLSDYAWYRENSGEVTHPVGEKLPNPWGLYDMHGNVWEWCADWYGDYPTNAEKDPGGPPSGEFCVLRGGSYLSRVQGAVSENRGRNLYANQADDYGFRLCVFPAPSR